MNNPGTFNFGNLILPYLRSDIDCAGNNSRSVEIPIALHLYNQSIDDRDDILELGSVLPNYIPAWNTMWSQLDPMPPASKRKIIFDPPHICIDPVDTRKGISKSNLDEYIPKRHFDLVISLSSLAHIYDTTPDILTEAAKISHFRDTIRRIKSFVEPHGTILITLPWGYSNPYVEGAWLDKVLLSLNHPEGAVKQDWEPNFALKYNRVGFGIAGNQWVQKNLRDVSLPYYTDVPSAGTVYVLIWTIT